jgi:hypothetical protein
MASVTDWSRVIGTTIVNHLREEELATFRKFKVFAALEASGNITMNQSGRGMDWNVRFRNTPVSGNTGDTPRTFARQSLWKRAELPWRGFVTTDSIFRREMLENRGQEALVNVASQMAQRLQESLEQHLAFQVYSDGNAAGKENDFHGLDTFLKYAADTTINSNQTANPFATRTGGGNNANAADKYGAPNATYAGLSCALGFYGGGRLSGTDIWPVAPVDPEADYWSPVIINYNSSGFSGPGGTGAGQNSWQDNCVEATREGIFQCKRNDTREAAIDMVVLDRNLYIQYLNRLNSTERALVTRSTGLRAYGFTDVFEQDGVEITSEYSVPAGRGYGISVGNMELHCLEGQLFTAEGPFFQEELQSYRYSCSVLGNLRFRSPRNFFLLAPVTAAT